MAEKMNRWGIGPKFALASATFGFLILGVSLYFKPLFAIPVAFFPWRLMAGSALIVVGILFKLVALFTVMRAFSDGKLVTGGIFGVCRHPVYASWIVFLAPGIVILAGTWLGFIIPFAMYALLRRMVSREEALLEETFGDDYRAYKRRIPAVLPIGRLKNSRAR